MSDETQRQILKELMRIRWVLNDMRDEVVPEDECGSPFPIGKLSELQKTHNQRSLDCINKMEMHEGDF